MHYCFLLEVVPIPIRLDVFYSHSDVIGVSRFLDFFHFNTYMQRGIIQVSDTLEET